MQSAAKVHFLDKSSESLSEFIDSNYSDYSNYRNYRNYRNYSYYNNKEKSRSRDGCGISDRGIPGKDYFT